MYDSIKNGGKLQVFILWIMSIPNYNSVALKKKRDKFIQGDQCVVYSYEIDVSHAPFFVNIIFLFCIENQPMQMSREILQLFSTQK